jgi:hypothetical protein
MTITVRFGVTDPQRLTLPLILTSSAFDDFSQRTAVSLEALAQDVPTGGSNRRNNHSKNNLFKG